MSAARRKIDAAAGTYWGLSDTELAHMLSLLDVFAESTIEDDAEEPAPELVDMEDEG
jgi:hypothetical protein